MKSFMTMLLIIICFALFGVIWSFRAPSYQCTSKKRSFLSRTTLCMQRELIIGLNKYSHDAACCLVDAADGKVLFTQAKERITGRKHDGGSVGSIVEYGLQSIGARLEDVSLVVSNNHHFRVTPFEQRLKFNKALHYVPSEYDDLYNTIPNAQHMELSHHLAHAWSAIGTAPFDSGLILVMDGMGESYKAMAEDILGVEDKSGDYMHDLKLLHGREGAGLIRHPTTMSPGSTYREAETAYAFDCAAATLSPVFKRWSRERSPSELYNHGFENMESLGAVYSRMSAHINGDWNACGKVMGLAPWAGRTQQEAADGWHFGPGPVADLDLGRKFYHKQQYMSGNLFDGSFKVNWEGLEALTNPNSWSDRRIGELATIAQNVQSDLEEVALSLCRALRLHTGARNLVLVGGVALNSVMNGRIRREAGFDKVFVPSAPGDEGVALGCALYGLQRHRQSKKKSKSKIGPVAFLQPKFPAYQGREHSESDIKDAILDMEPWVQIDDFPTEEELVEHAAKDLAEGKVIAWFQGRSEFGQRALGSRSILADPRKKSLRRAINEKIKQREWYRPLAPSVLDEHVSEWFTDLGSGENASPFMSLTATGRKDKTSQVPAIYHVDDTARLQTVTAGDAPLYHRLISAFCRLTGVPMVLNTSLNRKGQPIVETPAQALETLMLSEGHIEHLYLGKHRLSIRPMPFATPSLSAVPSAVEVQAEPTEQDRNVFVRCAPLYLTEVTHSASVSGGTNPLKVRVQAGAASDSVTNEVGGQWKTLPSVLHLDILQLLQVQDQLLGVPERTVEHSYMPPDLTVGELLQALRAVVDSEGQHAPQKQLRWSELREAFLWLYTRCLISFEDPAADSDNGLLL